MPKISTMFPSKYLRAADLEGPRTLVIKDVVLETAEDDNGKEEIFPVVLFEDEPKGLRLNRTNAGRIEELTGSDDTEDWAGFAVTLGPDKTDYKGKRVDCLRIADKAPTPPAAHAAADSGEVDMAAAAAALGLNPDQLAALRAMTAK